MKILDLIIKQEWFDAIRSGDKKTETREIRPNTAKKYVEFFDRRTGAVYASEADVPADAQLEARPLQYDAIRFFVGYAKDRASALVRVEKAEIFILQDAESQDIVYEYKGKEYVAAQIDYTLGDIIELNV